MVSPSSQKKQCLSHISSNIYTRKANSALLCHARKGIAAVFLVVFLCFQHLQVPTDTRELVVATGASLVEMDNQKQTTGILANNKLVQTKTVHRINTATVGSTSAFQDTSSSPQATMVDRTDMSIDSTVASLRGSVAEKEVASTATNSITTPAFIATPAAENSITKPSVCTNEQHSTISSTLAKTKYWHKISLLTRCPEESWIHNFFAQSTQENFLALNVGCNKGLDAVNLARLLSRDRQISPQDWKQRLGSAVQKAVCGTPSTARIPVDAPKATGQVHCIEPMPATLQTLEETLNAAPSPYREHLVLKHAVFSNTSGTAPFPNKTTGGEDSGLASCFGEEKAKCIDVPMLTVDEYVREIDMTDQQAIDVVMIDAEGFDYEILQGSKETLKRVKYLSFEVHSGNWKQHSLIHAVNNMLSDFTCYWAGHNKLWRITNCLNDELVAEYENKEWSNVACVHQRGADRELARAMEIIFERTLKETTKKKR